MQNLLGIIMHLNENIRNELKSQKIMGCNYKITDISLANCPRLLNKIHNKSLDNIVQYNTKCASLGN